MNFKKCTIWLCAALLGLAGQGAFAQSSAMTPESLAAKYPSGSIQSSEMADQALREVDQQRAAVEQKYANQQHVCYTKFFATSCLDAAKEERRLALAQIRKVEVDANAYIRSARVVQRDKDLAEKRARDASSPPKPLADVAPKQGPQGAPHDPNEGERRIAEHDAKVKAQQQQEAADAQKRADSVAAYEKRAADSEARQRDVAAKKAEKQRQAEAKAEKAQQDKDAAEKKAAAKAATSAGSSPAPASAPTTQAPVKP